MYCGSRRMAAMISAQVSSAGATGEPTPFGHRDAQPRAGLDIDVRPTGRSARSASAGQLLEQGAGKCVRSRISTSTSASRRRTASWPMPLTVLVKTLAL
jgi:hypothetical protein